MKQSCSPFNKIGPPKPNSGKNHVTVPGSDIWFDVYDPALVTTATCAVCLAVDSHGTLLVVKVYSAEWDQRNGYTLTGRKQFLDSLRDLQIFPKTCGTILTTERRVYFQLELLNCGSLDSCIQSGTAGLPDQHMRKLTEFLARSLSALRSRNILHESLTPAHVLANVEPTGEVTFRLGGYSSCKQVESLAPDQGFEQMFSLGALLYYLATGNPLVEKDFRTESSPQFPADSAGKANPTLLDLIGKLLIRNWGTTPADVLEHPYIKAYVQEPLACAEEMEKISEFEMGQLIYRGFGVCSPVYKCQRKGKRCLLKVSEVDQIESAERELRLMLDLKDLPIIPHVAEHFVHKRRFLVILEEEGLENISDYARRLSGKISIADTSKIAQTVATSLHYIREAYLPLALTSNNLFVGCNADGSIKCLRLFDFAPPTEAVDPVASLGTLLLMLLCEPGGQCLPEKQGLLRIAKRCMTAGATLEGVMRDLLPSPPIPERDSVAPYALGKRICDFDNVFECRKGTETFAARITLASAAASQKRLHDLNGGPTIPHMPQLRDMFQTGESLYTITTLPPGENLESYLRDKSPLTPASQELVVFHVLETLSALHHLGLLHGNVCAENAWVRVSAGEILEAVLTDFGEADAQKQAGCPPEVRQADAAEVKDPHKLDMWGLGRLIFRVVYGYPVEKYFSEESLYTPGIIKCYQEEPQPTSPAIRQFMILCLDRSPENRPTAETLLADEVFDRLRSNKGDNCV